MADTAVRSKTSVPLNMNVAPDTAADFRATAQHMGLRTGQLFERLWGEIQSRCGGTPAARPIPEGRGQDGVK